VAKKHVELRDSGSQRANLLILLHLPENVRESVLLQATAGQWKTIRDTRDRQGSPVPGNEPSPPRRYGNGEYKPTGFDLAPDEYVS